MKSPGNERVLARRPVSQGWLWLLSLLVGVVEGVGAVVFRELIGFFRNLLFLGQFSVAYNANVHTPSSPWGALVILAPVLGAAGVAFLVKNFASEAKGPRADSSCRRQRL